MGRMKELWEEMRLRDQEEADQFGPEMALEEEKEREEREE